MKVKVGDTLYDGEDQPILIILNDDDKENIASMPEDAHIYCEYPNTMTQEEVREWMNDESSLVIK